MRINHPPRYVDGASCHSWMLMYGTGHAVSTIYAAGTELTVEQLLQKVAAAREPYEELQAQHNMKQAHASLCVLKKSRDGVPLGFGFRQFDDWEDCMEAVNTAMPYLTSYGAPTFYACHHARELKCHALQGLQRDLPAFLALAEHVAAASQLLPPYCYAIYVLWTRFTAAKERLPAALQGRMEDKVAGLYGDSLSAMEARMEVLEEWLQQASLQTKRS